MVWEKVFGHHVAEDGEGVHSRGRDRANSGSIWDSWDRAHWTHPVRGCVGAGVKVGPGGPLVWLRVAT